MKFKKGQTAGFIVTGVIGVIVAIALLPVLASLIDDGQIVKTIALEQITNTAANTSFTLSNPSLVVGSISVVNSTCGEAGAGGEGWPCTANLSTLRDGSEFILNERLGTLKIVNRTGTWNVSFNYEPTTFVDSATGRTVVRQVTLMYGVFLIILTLAAVGINVMKGGK